MRSSHAVLVAASLSSPRISNFTTTTLLLPTAVRALIAPPVWHRRPGRYPHLHVDLRRSGNRRALKRRPSILHIERSTSANAESRHAAVEQRSVELASVDYELTAGDIVELRAARSAAATRTSSYTDPVGTLVGYGFYEPQMKAVLPAISGGPADSHSSFRSVDAHDGNSVDPTSIGSAQTAARSVPEVVPGSPTSTVTAAAEGRVVWFASLPYVDAKTPQAVLGQAATATVIDDDFWVARAQRAIAARQGLLPNARTARTDGYRMLHGDGDGVPGVYVDAYGAHMRVMRVTSVGALRHAAPSILRLLLTGGPDVTGVSAGGDGVAQAPMRPVAVLVEVAHSVLCAATSGGVASLSAVSVDDEAACCERLQQLLGASLPWWFGADVKVYPVAPSVPSAVIRGDPKTLSGRDMPTRSTTRPATIGLFFVPGTSHAAVWARAAATSTSLATTGRRPHASTSSVVVPRFFSEAGVKVLAPDPSLPATTAAAAAATAGGAPRSNVARPGTIMNDTSGDAFDVALADGERSATTAGAPLFGSDALGWATVPLPRIDFALRATRRLIRDLAPSCVVAIDGDVGGGFAVACALGCASRIATFSSGLEDANTVHAALQLNELAQAPYSKGGSRDALDADDDDDDDGHHVPSSSRATTQSRGPPAAAAPPTPATRPESIAVVPATLSVALAAAAAGATTPPLPQAKGKKSNKRGDAKRSKVPPPSPALALPPGCDMLIAHLSLTDVDGFIQTLCRYHAFLQQREKQKQSAVRPTAVLSPEAASDALLSGCSEIGAGDRAAAKDMDVDLSLSLQDQDDGDGGNRSATKCFARGDSLTGTLVNATSGKSEFDSYSQAALAAMAAWCPTQDVRAEENATAIAAVAAHHVRSLLPALALFRGLDAKTSTPQNQRRREATVVVTTELGGADQIPFVRLKAVARFLPMEQLMMVVPTAAPAARSATTGPPEAPQQQRMLWTVMKEMEAYGADYPLSSGADAFKLRLEDLVATVLTVRPAS